MYAQTVLRAPCSTRFKGSCQQAFTSARQPVRPTKVQALRQTGSEECQQTYSRRSAGGMLLAAPLLSWMAGEIAVQPAKAAATATSSSNRALEEYMELEDKGKLSDTRTLENYR